MRFGHDRRGKSRCTLTLRVPIVSSRVIGKFVQEQRECPLGIYDKNEAEIEIPNRRAKIRASKGKGQMKQDRHESSTTNHICIQL